MRVIGTCTWRLCNSFYKIQHVQFSNGCIRLQVLYASHPEEYDSYIVVSFTNATLVLSIGETVEEVTDSGFLGTSPTLACSRLGEDALIQVPNYVLFVVLLYQCLLLQIYPDGIRHIRADKRVNEWRSPGKRTITKCALNERQVVIGLSGGEIVYFEMDLVS